MRMHITTAGRSWLLLLALLPATGVHGQDCVLNANPACSSAVNLGALPGDSDTPVITRVGTGEAFFSVRIQETSSNTRALNARVQLHVPPRMDYDLIVRCASSSSKVLRSNRAGIGATETVAVTRNDTWTDNSFTLFIEVKHHSGSSCDPWTLSIAGNTTQVAASSALVCN